MNLGYNTNGTTGHRWCQVIELMAEMGYRSVAITIDHSCLDPYSSELPHEIDRMRRLLERFQMTSVIETGARFLLDPRKKHEPTLVTQSPEGRDIRVDFLKRCIMIAKVLKSDAVSFWSGIARETPNRAEAFERLAEGCRRVLDFAESLNVKLAFEPEPGMLVQSMNDYRTLLSLVDGPGFGLTIDIGHLHCVETESISECLIAWKDRIFNIHIEDMKRGIHDHLRFGEGTINFAPVFKTLHAIHYNGSVNVELSRHSHMAPEVMLESFKFLAPLMQESLVKTAV
jgi:sugar phosphate isomerase/epimerase